MLRSLIGFLLIVSLVISSSQVWAAPNLLNAELNTSGTSRTLVLPAAADNTPVISLGSAVDPVSGKIVEGLAIIHPRREFTHKPQHGGGGGGTTTSKCYSFLSQGTKWKSFENWLVNGTNLDGLDPDFVFANLGADIAKWEDAGDGVVGNGTSVNILGDGSQTESVLAADNQSPDGVNEVLFANVSTSGAIAVTIVWGIFGGPPFGRELVEWDMVFDDVDFDWSASGGAGKMDFANIATHEIGHAGGMGHPDDSCVEETMYRFASFGEITKQDLHAGDIAGINQLY